MGKEYRFEFARLRDDRHPNSAPRRRQGRALFKAALQTLSAELPDVFWVDGVLVIAEPDTDG